MVSTVSTRRIDASTPNQRPPQTVDPFERDRLRFSNYAEARDFVNRIQWEGRRHANELRPVFNYALTLARKSISYVYPDPVSFTVPAVAGETEEQTTAVETLLADLLHELDADELDFALALDSSIYGDAAIKITWDAATQRPRLTAVDPATLAVDWSPDTPTEAWRVHQMYDLDGGALIERKLVAPNSDLLPGKLYKVREVWTLDRWRMEVAGQTAQDRANPYGWIPYLILPNNRRATEFWGHSDLEDLYDVFRLVNTRIRDLDQILTLSGAPIAVLENVDGSEGIRVGPGAKWEIPEGAKAYLLDLLAGQGVDLHISFIDTLYRVMHDLSESPRTAFGDSGRDLSGAALEVEIQPLVQKIKRKRRALDRFYRRRNAMLLDLLAKFGGAETHGLRQTVTVWPPILPSDEETEVRLVTQQVNTNLLSRHTGMHRLGSTDPDKEMEKILDEAERLREAQQGPEAAQEGTQGQEAKGQKGGYTKAKPKTANRDKTPAEPDGGESDE